MKIIRLSSSHNILLFIIPVAMLAIALFDLPYGYYQVMRFVICGCCGYVAYQEYTASKWQLWVVVFLAIAILYTPFFRIHFTREIWGILNVATMAVLICAVAMNSKKSKECGGNQ